MKPTRIAATLAAGALAAAAMPGSAAFAFRPDIVALPFECSGYDAEARTCTSTSYAEMTSPDAGIATSSIRYSINPAMLSLPGTRATFVVTVRGPISIGADDVFCASPDVEVTVVPDDPSTPAEFTAEVGRLVAASMAGGPSCYRYEPVAENIVNVFILAPDGTDFPVPPRPLWLFTMEEGMALSLAAAQ